MTMGPDPMRRIFLRSVRFGMEGGCHRQTGRGYIPLNPRDAGGRTKGRRQAMDVWPAIRGRNHARSAVASRLHEAPVKPRRDSGARTLPPFKTSVEPETTYRSAATNRSEPGSYANTSPGAPAIHFASGTVTGSGRFSPGFGGRKTRTETITSRTSTP